MYIHGRHVLYLPSGVSSTTNIIEYCPCRCVSLECGELPPQVPDHGVLTYEEWDEITYTCDTYAMCVLFYILMHVMVCIYLIVYRAQTMLVVMSSPFYIYSAFFLCCEHFVAII